MKFLRGNVWIQKNVNLDSVNIGGIVVRKMANVRSMNFVRLIWTNMIMT
jgi:hypothetical protein